MNGPFGGFLGIARKEFLHIRRDPATLVFALVTPLLQLVLFGYAIDFDVRHVPAVVVDQDRSRESRAYLEGVAATGRIDLVLRADRPEDAVDAMRRGDARAAIIVPPDFAARTGTAIPPTVRVLLDGSDSLVSTAARGAFVRPAAPDAPQGVDVRIGVLYNPEARTAVYTIPGLIGVILQLVTVTLTSFSLVRERESGTLDQLMVTPVSRLGLMLGKLVPYAVLAMAVFAGVLGLARLIFAVPIAGSLALLTAASALFVLAGLALGLLISTLAATQAQALQMAILTLLPSILLSGYIAPREALPGPLVVLSEALPVTHFIVIARGIMVRGAGAADVWPSALALAAIALGLVAVAAMRFRKTLG